MGLLAVFLPQSAVEIKPRRVWSLSTKRQKFAQRHVSGVCGILFFHLRVFFALPTPPVSGQGDIKLLCLLSG